MKFAYGVAVVPIVLAVYMYKIASISKQQRMGLKGPGIRTTQTLATPETWKAAQAAAAPLFLNTAVAMGVAAVLALGLGALDAPRPAIVLVPAVVGLGCMVFFLGVASVRANKAAADAGAPPAPDKSRPPKKKR